jgi:hypothetical protein
MTVKTLHQLLENIPESYEIQFGKNEEKASRIDVQHFPDEKLGFVVLL